MSQQEVSSKESSQRDAMNRDSDVQREATALESLEEGQNRAYPWVRSSPKYDDASNRRPTYPSSSTTKSAHKPRPPVFVPPPQNVNSPQSQSLRWAPKYDDETNRRPTYPSSSNTQSCYKPRPPVLIPPPQKLPPQQKVNNASESSSRVTATINKTAETGLLSVPSPSGTGLIICPKPTRVIPVAKFQALLEMEEQDPEDEESTA
ncbi:hypothetical protein CVT24_001823 [Panaeolus cyanescens]|uniref:Uncharacterized protein n=1 Tax=Panaeolus cyanescens TaxID=181874 RepID=A0A409YFH4_9AGAR|nr:hypothetical protein CVT24_001823 [Panaeolus cyanescens]